MRRKINRFSVFLLAFLLLTCVNGKFARAHRVIFPRGEQSGFNYRLDLGITGGEQDYEYDGGFGENAAGYNGIKISNNFQFGGSHLLGLDLGFTALDAGTFKNSTDSFDADGGYGLDWGIRYSSLLLKDFAGMDLFMDFYYSKVSSDPDDGSMKTSDYHLALGLKQSVGTLKISEGIKYSDSTLDITGTSENGSDVDLEGEASNNFGLFVTVNKPINDSLSFYGEANMLDELMLSFGSTVEFGESDTKSSEEPQASVEKTPESRPDPSPSETETVEEQPKIEEELPPMKQPAEEDQKKEDLPEIKEEEESSLEISSDLEPGIDWEKQFAQGKEKYNSGEYEAARPRFLKAVEAKPEDVDSLIWLGVTEYQLENYEESAERLNKVLELDPDNDYARNILEKVKQERIDWEDELEKGIEKLRQEELKEAREHFLKVRKANPEHVNNLIYLGVVEYNLDMKQKAISRMRRALELDPDNQTVKDYLDKME